jgi:hypothetical protein
MPSVPQWTAELYDEIERELKKLGGREKQKRSGTPLQ